MEHEDFDAVFKRTCKQRLMAAIDRDLDSLAEDLVCLSDGHSVMEGAAREQIPAVMLR